MTFKTKLLTLTFLLALTTACSNKFFYNQLDWLIPWYVDDYVDLTLVQKENLNGQVKMLLRWHRGEELSRYVEILDQVETDIAGTVTTETVQGWFDDVLTAAKRVEESILPEAIKLGEELTDEQMADFVSNLWQRQKELEKEYLGRTKKEYSEQSYKSLTKNLAKYAGRLNQEQKQILEDAANKLQRFDNVWLEDRKAWLEKIEGLLKREPGWQQAVEEAFVSREQQRDKRFKQYFVYNTGIINGAVAEVINQLSDKQRKKLRYEIADIRDEFKLIIASAE